MPSCKGAPKYLKFFWNNKYYKFTCFPNGLACCPRQFTKLMKPVFSTLRKEGHISASYIDDTYLQGDTKEECQINVYETVNLFHSLSLVSHPGKSVFEPTQILIFLGFEINSINMTVKLTVEKVTQLVDACQMLIQSTTTSIRSVAQVIGYMVASSITLSCWQYYTPYKHLRKILKMHMLKLCVTTQQQFHALTTWGLVIQTFVIH